MDTPARSWDTVSTTVWDRPGGRNQYRVGMAHPVTDPLHVRLAGLAENLAAPDELLQLLAATDIPVVLLTVAARDRISQEVTELLTARWRATGRTSCSSAVGAASVNWATWTRAVCGCTHSSRPLARW